MVSYATMMYSIASFPQWFFARRGSIIPGGGSIGCHVDLTRTVPMHKFMCGLILAACSGALAADNGLISVKSDYDVKTTADRLVNLMATKGMSVFIRIDHARGAQQIGETLRPTELVIFGNPRVGTPLMQCSQSMAIDLP